MTIGPDLTDDNGRLRPEVARVLQEVPDRPLPPQRQEPHAPIGAPEAILADPVPPAVPRPRVAPARDLNEPRRTLPPILGPRRQDGLPVREIRLAIPDLAAARVSLGNALLLTILVGGLSLYAGTRMSGRVAWPAAHSVEPEATAPGSIEGSRAGVITGINVNLRSGAGLGYPVITKLDSGESISLLDERDGWCSVATSSGAMGWVFGAYVSGMASPARGPAIVQRTMLAGSSPTRLVLRPGERVIHERTRDGRHIALLPDGRRIGVEEGGLIDVR